MSALRVFMYHSFHCVFQAMLDFACWTDVFVKCWCDVPILGAAIDSSWQQLNLLDPEVRQHNLDRLSRAWVCDGSSHSCLSSRLSRVSLPGRHSSHHKRTH